MKSVQPFNLAIKILSAVICIDIRECFKSIHSLL